MKILATLIFLLPFLSLRAQFVINDPNAEIRNVTSPFSSIEVSNAIVVVLTKGTSNQIAVSNSKPENIPSIKTEITNGVLHIYYQSPSFRIRNSGNMKVYVAYTNLNSIKASGASVVTFTDKFRGDQLNIDLSGASELKGDMEADRLIVKLTGASLARLSGKTNELQLNSSGASDFKSPGLSTESCIADISGASDADVTVTNSLKVKASGASDFNYRGNPLKTQIEKSGSSDVSSKN